METIPAIQKLLFLEDCLIIPGLGGFVSRYRPAVIDRSTGTFMPPAKEVAFNDELLQNDGQLVSFISEKGGIPMNMARLQVELFVEETKVMLTRNQTVSLGEIGHFIRNSNGRISFQIDPGANLYPDSYGLAPFQLRQVVREESAGIAEIPVTELKRTPVNLNLRRIAIAMPLLIVFSLLPYHSRVTDSLTSSPASMLPEPSLFHLNYPDIKLRDTTKMVEFPIREEVTSDTVTSDTVTSDGKGEVKKEEPKPEISPVIGKFQVIAGCFKIRANADRLHKQLVEKGYPAAIAPSRNGLLFKVSVESYASREEALNGLSRLKHAEPGLDLWVAL
jgi:nucleoid DNA-binding protein